MSNPVFREEDAKLWMIFDIQDFDIIDHFEEDPFSKYGTYYGNSKNNNFFTVQGSSQEREIHAKVKRQVNCPAQNEFTVQLQSYHYNLFAKKEMIHFILDRRCHM